MMILVFLMLRLVGFFYDAVCWAAELGITKGTTATTFDPDREVTLQETIIFLYRYAQHEECGNMTYVMPDPTRMTSRIGMSGYSYTIAASARNAMNWAVNCGVVADNLTYFNGNATATRAICADYLWRFDCLALGGKLVLSISELVEWPGPKSVQEQLEDYYYSVHYFLDLYPVAAEFAFYNNDIVYIRTHGTEEGTVYGEGIVTRDGQCLYDHDIQEGSMENVDLVYLSACYAGDLFGGALYNVGGAKAVVGFRNIIWSERDGETYKGVDYFDERFFWYYTTEDWSLEMCTAAAKADVYEMFGNYRGTDSVYPYE